MAGKEITASCLNIDYHFLILLLFDTNNGNYITNGSKILFAQDFFYCSLFAAEAVSLHIS